MNQDTYQEALRRIIRGEVKMGRKSLVAVLRACEGAPPETVKPILDEELTLAVSGLPISMGTLEAPTSMDAPPMVSSLLGHLFRARLAELFRKLPAPNPELAQWWFDIDTIEYLVLEIERLSDRSAKVLCIGAPTVAFGLAIREVDVTLLDADQHILVEVFGRLRESEKPRMTCRQFSVEGDDLVSEFIEEKAAIVFMDPPWYMAKFGKFLKCGISMLAPGGSLFMTLLPRLTRESAEQDREKIVASLQDAGLSVLAVERARLGYVVPRFEKSTYTTIPEFTGLPWRRGDLVHARTGSDGGNSSVFADFAEEVSSVPKFKVYSRNPVQFRVFAVADFAKDDVRQANLQSPSLYPEYSKTVSSRSRADGFPQVWTSEKIGMWGGGIYALGTVHEVLEAWERGCSCDDVIEQLASRQGVREVTSALDEHLHLWGRFEGVKEVEDPTREPIGTMADKENSRREHAENSDPYRNQPSSRDRDRVVWSDGLRKLANKTQVFPASRDDQLRQRLTHSMEVVQLATTIGNALSLDLHLIEAGGLAHDIGHAPFGHAGEHALHYVMAKVHPQLFFSHYEHGVDVVRFLEAPYQHHPGFPGLNLSRATIDCIFKHIYFHGDPASGGDFCGAGGSFGVPRAPKSLAELFSCSKHKEYLNFDYCHAEGQAVRLADKISYLLSDIEDGIRLGAISFEDIRSCCLFLRPPIDFTSRLGESLSAVFIRERRNIIRVLMEDVIDSSKRLFYQQQRKQAAPGRVVDHSPMIGLEMTEVWTRLQKGLLHKFPAVRQSNLRAAKVVSEIFVAFALMPDLVDSRFREVHLDLAKDPAGRKYEDTVGVKVVVPKDLRNFIPLERVVGVDAEKIEGGEVHMRDFILAKDYVASLSDDHAEDLHARLFA